VDLLARYSNPDNVTRLNRILSGQGRDRPSHRPVPSLRQKQTKLTQEQVSELVTMHERGIPIDDLASVFDVHRTTVMTHLDRAGA
jgi:DNA-directed RNA polymerase specialized sigma24 family protein